MLRHVSSQGGSVRTESVCLSVCGESVLVDLVSGTKSLIMIVWLHTLLCTFILQAKTRMNKASVLVWESSLCVFP